MTDKHLDAVVKATVKLPCMGGQGVLVGGGLILTAAHCLDYDSTTGVQITLGDQPLIEVETADGLNFMLTPWVIESVSDIALLGPPDNQSYGEDVEKLEDFCFKTKAVPIFRGVLIGASVPIMIRSHKQRWINGTVEQHGLSSHRVGIRADEQVEGGTSGGPIVTKEGHLVGIVSQSSETGGPCIGVTPRPHLALPSWAAKLIYKRRFEGHF